MTRTKDDPPLAPVSAVVRKKAVPLGRRFAGSLATRLDAHPSSQDGLRVEEERRILALMREVLMAKDPDRCSVSFLTHAVEVFTKTHGYSKAIYDELFRLHQVRAERGRRSEGSEGSEEAAPAVRFELPASA